MIALARPVMLYHKIEIDAAAGSGITAGSVFGLGLPLVVTNAAGVSLGGVLTDADVTVTMAEGGVADDFTIVCYGLPSHAVSALKAKHAGDDNSPGLSVTIRLGYLDTPTTVYAIKPVLRGRVTNIKEATTDAGRSTVTLTGEEEVGYVLRTTRAAAKVAQGDADTLISDLLDLARTRAKKLEIAAESIKLTAGSKLGTKLTNYTVSNYSVLAVLADLAKTAGQALVVGSEGIAFGTAVGGGAGAVTFEASTNTVSFTASSKEKSDGGGGGSGGGGAGAASAAVSALAGSAGGDKGAGSTITVTALGDPELRVGRSVAVADGNPTSTWKGKSLRIQQVKHVYDTSKGFTSVVTATAAEAGKPATDFKGARGVVDQWNKEIGKDRSANPSVDMGQASSYTTGSSASATEAGHRVTLHYGPKVEEKKAAPKPTPGEAKKPKESPSTDQEITDDTRTDLLQRPIASVFAFDKVGLVTPVYPGMRAVLVHNGQSTNDAIVAGWLWSAKPPMTPPPNQQGDYWLALPTDVDQQSGLPKGKGVNDLIDAKGNRVITSTSMRIVVGDSALDAVGTRPTVTDADTLVIEHASGTKITVDKNGGITIESADEVKVSTKGKPITFGNGSVSLKIDGASVQVGQ